MAIKTLQTAPWNASLGFRGCSEHFNSQSLKSETAYKIHLKLMMLWIASKKLLVLFQKVVSKLRSVSFCQPSDLYLFARCFVQTEDSQKQVAVLSVSICCCHLALPLFGPFVPLALVALFGLGPFGPLLPALLHALTASGNLLHHATVHCALSSRHATVDFIEAFMVSTH